MQNIKRRNFLKGLAIASASFLLQKDISGETIPKQSVSVNIPSYSLKLINYIDNDFSEIYHFDVGVGRGDNGRRQTPICKGFLNDKREDISFKYRFNDPFREIQKGAKIEFTNTFDKKGNPVRYKVQYENMRGIGMKLMDEKRKKFMLDFVIHTTLDEFTIGIPSSDGCIRLGMDDMLALYEIVYPEKSNGKINSRIPINISYNILEISDGFVCLHADVYNRDNDYFEKFKKMIKNYPSHEKMLDYKRINDCFRSDAEDFKNSYRKILDTLYLPYPKNFVSQQLKSKLHKKYNLDYFLL